MANLSFNIELSSTIDANRTLVSNIGRSIVKKLAVKFEGNEILSIDNFHIFTCYRDLYTRDTSKFYNPKIQKVSVTIEGKPNQLNAQGMRSFEQYDEARKYFAEGRLANEVQAQLQLYDISLGEYLVNKYALWLDFRMIDENELHGMGKRIENASSTLQIEKKVKSAGALNAYIYLIMDAQLNIQNDAYVSAVY